MSTKINSRSPFYLTASEPTATISSYSCADASGVAGTTQLQGMTITADGTIGDPAVANGGIIVTRSVTQFNTNSTGAIIPNQSVDFGIRVPPGFTNTGQIITCNAKADQPPTTASGCNASTSKAIFTGDTGGATIGNITNLDNDTAQTISLGTFFSNGSSGAITTYEIFPQNIFNTIVVSLSGSGANQTLSLRNSGASGTLSVRVVAHNSLDGCTTSSNTFTVGLVPGSTGAAKSLHCTTSNSTTDAVNASYPDTSIPASGVLNSPASGSFGTFVEYRATSSGSPITNIGVRSVSGSITQNFFAVFTVPSGYSNSGDTLVCAISATQLGTAKPAFNCDQVGITGFDITSNGDILKHNGKVRFNNTFLSFTNVRTNADEQKFAENTSSSSVTRTIKVDFTIPNDFSDGGQTTTCTADFSQAPSPNPCASINVNDINIQFFLARQGFAQKASYCTSNLTYDCDTRVFLPSGLSFGAPVCFNGSPFNGGNLFYGIRHKTPGLVGGNTGSFTVVRINSQGVITAEEPANCGNNLTDPIPIIF